MTDSADTSKDKTEQTKPSLKDIAAKDEAQATQDGEAKDAKASDSKAPDSKAPDSKAGDPAPKKGNGFVWVLLILIVIGGGVAAGWPYIGPKVEPAVADLRKLMGLAPRPTQATLPSETQPQTAPDAALDAPIASESAPATGPETPAPAEEAAVDQAAPETSTPETSTPEASMTEEQASTQETPPLDAAPMGDGTDPAALATDLEVLKSRVDALASMVGSVSGEEAQAALDATAELTRTIAALQSEIQTLRGRVQELEDGAKADPTAPAQALVLASTQVRARLMGDDPFAAELSALEHIAGADPAVHDAVQRLRPHAEVGVPTEAALTARFPKVAKAIIGARTTGEADGWLGRVKDGLGGLVTVRRTDPQAITDDVERAVAVAEAALELGDLAEAVGALETLQGAPGDAAAAWLGEARARVEAEAALEDLHTHALAALSAAGGR